jgi:hypothetical protein
MAGSRHPGRVFPHSSAGSGRAGGPRTNVAQSAGSRSVRLSLTPDEHRCPEPPLTSRTRVARRARGRPSALQPPPMPRIGPARPKLRRPRWRVARGRLAVARTPLAAGMPRPCGAAGSSPPVTAPLRRGSPSPFGDRPQGSKPDEASAPQRTSVPPRPAPPWRSGVRVPPLRALRNERGLAVVATTAGVATPLPGGADGLRPRYGLPHLRRVRTHTRRRRAARWEARAARGRLAAMNPSLLQIAHANAVRAEQARRRRGR